MNRNWTEYLLQHHCQPGKRQFFSFGEGCIICTPEEFGDFYRKYISERPNDVTFDILNLYEGEDTGVSYME